MAALHNPPRECDGGNPATTALAMRGRNPTAGNLLPHTGQKTPEQKIGQHFPLSFTTSACGKQGIYEESREKQKNIKKHQHGPTVFVRASWFRMGSATRGRANEHARTCATIKQQHFPCERGRVREAEGGMRWIYSVNQIIIDLR